MLINMFVGRPPGNYDHILDFSRAVTGTLFFVPSATLLDSLTAAPPAPAASTETPAAESSSSSTSPICDGSLRIGSLKGESQHE
jgi:porphyrinogen peroxidase